MILQEASVDDDDEYLFEDIEEEQESSLLSDAETA